MGHSSLTSSSGNKQVHTRTYKIGITGNICSGKSRVRKFLSKMGLSAIDTSEIAFNIISSRPELMRKISQQYSAQLVDVFGKLSRKKLEELTSSTGFDKQFLQDIVSPLVRDEVKRFLYGPLGTTVRFVESPLLFETASEHLYDEVWMVWVDYQIQLERLVIQDKVSKDEGHLRIVSEYPQESKKEKATRVIDNSGDWLKTETQIREAYEDVKARAFSKGH
ncbi:MAG: dephospho-CoA kinase [Vampirovibrionales bacterium]|nr:dephospho-CoA kinase [Vampirovibrionales bacterium]